MILSRVAIGQDKVSSICASYRWHRPGYANKLDHHYSPNTNAKHWSDKGKKYLSYNNSVYYALPLLYLKCILIN